VWEQFPLFFFYLSTDFISGIKLLIMVAFPLQRARERLISVTVQVEVATWHTALGIRQDSGVLKLSLSAPRP
jgi:hypothetical protein